MDLKNKVALITGALSNTGYAYAACLLQNGAKVALCDKNLKKCKSMAKQLVKMFGVSENILAVKCNVTDENQFENTFKSCINYFKRIDIVINNASLAINDSVNKSDLIINVHYGGVVRGTILAMKYMGSPIGTGGTVLQTAFEASDLSTNFSITSKYRALKQLVVNYTKATGDPNCLERFNIRIMALCPRGCLHYFGQNLIHILKYGNTGDCWIIENHRTPRLI